EQERESRGKKHTFSRWSSPLAGGDVVLRREREGDEVAAQFIPSRRWSDREIFPPALLGLACRLPVLVLARQAQCRDASCAEKGSITGSTTWRCFSSYRTVRRGGAVTLRNDDCRWLAIKVGFVRARCSRRF